MFQVGDEVESVVDLNWILGVGAVGVVIGMNERHGWIHVSWKHPRGERLSLHFCDGLLSEPTGWDVLPNQIKLRVESWENE